MNQTDRLTGLSILLVEDEALIAMILADALTSFGCRVVGPAGRLRKALDLIETVALDGAVLDVNVGGELVYPVAEILAARGVGFIFTTGYGALELDPRFAGARVVAKPFLVPALRQALLESLFETVG